MINFTKNKKPVLRPYVFLTPNVCCLVERSATKPDDCVGPFKTMRGAKWYAQHAWDFDNIHLTIAQIERMAKADFVFLQ